MSDDTEHTHAVIDGVIQHVSPSQIETFDPETFGGCETKWWFRKVLRVPVTQTVAQGLGTAMHSEIESYLETGVDTLGRLARSGKRFMPRPREFLFVEVNAGKLHPVHVAGIRVDQRIDVVNYSGRYVDDNGDTHDDPDCVEVEDWKSTSSMQYAKNAEELRRSVQMVSYGVWVASRARYWLEQEIDLKRVRLSHGVFVTRGASAARKTTTTIGLEELATKWQRVEGVVERMKGVARLKVVADVPRNLSACDAYGGCPFREICPRPAFSDFSFLDGGSNGMGVFDDMFSSAPSAPAATPAEVAGKTIGVPIYDAGTPARATADAALAAEIERLKAEELAAKNPAAAVKGAGMPEIPVVLKVDVEAHGIEKATQMAIERKRSVGVLPADAPVVTGAAAAEPIPPEVLATLHPAIQKAHDAMVAEGMQVVIKAPDVGPGEGHTGGALYLAPPQVMGALEGDVIVEVTKLRRGRPPKAAKAPPTVAEREALGAALDAVVNDPTAESRMQAAVNEGVAAPPAADATQPGKGAGGSPTGLTGTMTTDPNCPDKTRIVKVADERMDLTIVNGRIESDVRNGITVFADVALAGIAADDLEPYVADMLRKMEKQFGVADVRFSPKDSPLAYGGWKGALVAGVSAMPPAPGVYRLAFVKGNEMRELVLEGLQKAGAAIARGV